MVGKIYLAKIYFTDLSEYKIRPVLVIKELDAEAGSFFTYDENIKQIICTDAIGPTKNDIIGIKIPYGQGVVGWCINIKKPTIIYDTTQDKRFKNNVDDKTGFTTKSIICVPIVYKRKSLGAIELFNKKGEDGKFSDSDMEIMNIFGLSSSPKVKVNVLFSPKETF